MVELPKTVEQAVDAIISWLSEEEKEAIRADEPDLIDFHYTLGLRIRNELGPWGRNPELVRALVGDRFFFEADGLSQELLEAVQRRLLEERA